MYFEMDKPASESVRNYSVFVLYNGYSSMNEEGTEMKANCTCTLVKGKQNLIVDTMTAWDQDKILKGLSDHNLKPEEINYVVSSHGHSDHIGNNNLFLKATHIVGFSISFKNTYYIHNFEKGNPFKIDDDVEIIPTPGHTLSDVTVIVKTQLQGTCAITGDLFERAEDVDNAELWLEAGSENPKLQRHHRAAVAKVADWIIPGHGEPFKMTDEIRKKLQSQLTD